MAPFIAEAGVAPLPAASRLVHEGEDGKPLPADKVTFGGWRRGPWYALDGTHPEVQKHLESVFRTMREEWGVTYFKLDANFWGAMHGGRLHDPKATRIEAYRRGMQAVLRGAGDSFILGCNHPIWPSFGLIHGSRSSGDIKRKWATFAKIARQNLSRNWQNGRLWWNDPDAVVLTAARCRRRISVPRHCGSRPAAWCSRATTYTAPGRPGGDAAEAAAAHRRGGGIRRRLARCREREAGNRRMICVFNWGDTVRTGLVRLPWPAQVTDFWSGAALGRHRVLMKSGIFRALGAVARLQAKLVRIRAIFRVFASVPGGIM